MANKGKAQKKGWILITGGLLLIVAALFLVGYNLWEENQAMQSSNVVVTQLTDKIHAQIQEKETAEDQTTTGESGNLPVEPSLPDYVLNPDMEMPVETIDGRDYIGVLEVPSYNLVLPVISEWSYPSLKIAPCRYSGSVYKDNFVIAGHNYRAHFSNVKKLQPGDTVIFTDMEGNVFQYRVVLNETLQPREVEEMTSGDWDLSLFTCNYGGSARVTIRCEKIEA